MFKYEYKVIILNKVSEDEAEEELNIIGDDGWELITVDQNRAFFIRVTQQDNEDKILGLDW